MSRGLFWLGSASLLSQVLDAITIVVVLWFLNRAEIGVATLAWSVSVLAEAFNGLGVGTAIIQATALSRRQLSALYWYAIGVAVASGAIICLAAPWLADYYAQPDLAPMIRVSAAKLLFVGAALVPLQLLSRDMEFKQLGAIGTVATLLAAMTRIGLAAAGFGAWSLVIGNVAHGLVTLLSVLVISPFRPRLMLPLDEVRQEIRFGLKVAASGVLYQLYRNADYFLIGGLLGMQALGLYRAAFDIAMSPAIAVLNVVNRSALPVLARLKDDREQLLAAFLWTTRSLALMLAPICVLLFFAAEPLLAVVSRPQWYGAAPALRLLSIAAFVRSLAQAFPQLFHAAGKPGLAVYDAAVSLVIIVTSLWLFLLTVGDQHGVLAACMAWLSAYPVLIGFLLYLSQRVVPIPVAVYVRSWLPGLSGGAWMVITLSLAGVLLDRLGAPSSVRLAVLLVAGLGTYGGFLRWRLGVRLHDLFKVGNAEPTAAEQA